jgi:antitoxin ParD1/3/4
MMTMARTVTVSLGPHYEEFIQKAIAGGRFNNVSEVIRAALRQMEDEEARLSAIRSALVEGENSGIVEDFDPQTYVQKLNEEYDAQVQTF